LSTPGAHGPTTIVTKEISFVPSIFDAARRITYFARGIVALGNRTLHWGAAAIADARNTAANLEIRTLSTRPDTVTGGNVLIEVAIPLRTPHADVRVFANERNVTSALRWDPTNVH
jgi:hypothetical protein